MQEARKDFGEKICGRNKHGRLCGLVKAGKKVNNEVQIQAGRCKATKKRGTVL